MKKTITMIILAAVCALNGYAQSAEQTDISTSERGRLVLERKTEKDSIAALDKVLLIKDAATTVVFDSEGRSIQQVLEKDLNADGVPELLIQMDLGGSGGFKEFALLQIADGAYKPVWEETGFAAGNAVVEDRDKDGRENLYIDYSDTDVEPAKEATAMFGFEEGKFKQLEMKKL